MRLGLSSKSHRWIAGIALGTMLLAVGTPLLGLRVFAATDLLLSHAPWATGPPDADPAHNSVFGDTVSTFLPLHAEFRRGVLGGDFPTWTPFPGGGHPLGSVPDSGSLGPLGVALPVRCFSRVRSMLSIWWRSDTNMSSGCRPVTM